MSKRPFFPFRVLIYGMIMLIIASACSSEDAVAPDPTPDVQALQLETFESLWKTIDENYVYLDTAEVDWDEVYDTYRPQVAAGLSPEAFNETLVEMLAELPETAVATYLSRQERLDQALEDTTSFEGIGAFVSVRNEPDPRIILLWVMNNSPAQQAGLQARDSILAIDGVPIAEDATLDEISRIRGPAGSEVVLTVRSPGQEVRDVAVTRERVQRTTPVVQYNTIEDSGVGYFLFPPAVYEGLVDDIFAGIETLTNEANLNALIFDLRIATSDTGWPIEVLLTLFSNGEVGERYTLTESSPLIVNGQDVLNSQQIPLVVIIGPDTAGIPEMFAAALQASGRAQIVGMPTAGDLEIFRSFFLANGSQVLVPTSTFRTNDGREIGLEGILPDVVLDADWDESTFAEDPARLAAIDLLRSQQ